MSSCENDFSDANITRILVAILIFLVFLIKIKYYGQKGKVAKGDKLPSS